MPNRILSNAALFRVVVFISFTWLVSACGGGGGGSRTPDDTTPTAFSFAAQSDAELNEGFESESVEISGINTETPVSIVGGEYSIDGDDFTDLAGSITNGQSIIVSLDASDEFETTTEAVLTVGGVTVSFEVTTFAEDSTPAELSFTAQTDVELTEEITSNSVTVTDINTSASVSIEGGEYSIDGGEFTAAAGSITEGQTIVVNLAPSAEFETSTEATLTVGDVTGIFEVTTRAADIEPAAFTFTDVDEVDFGTEVESNEVAITGIEIPVAISIVDGEYSIAGGDFTAEAGTVESGQAVQVRGTSGVIPSSTVDVTLTVGPTSDTFTITAIADTTAPEAVILFPPKNSATEGATLLVRGTASDDLSVITGVTVGGVSASSDDGFATWEADVPLIEGENDLVVLVEDAASNINSEADSVSVLHDPERGTFSSEFFRAGNILQFTFDSKRNRFIAGGGDIESLFAIDLVTGEPSLLTDGSLLNPDEVSLGDPGPILVREDTMWVFRNGTVFTVDLSSLESPNIKVISNNEIPNESNPFISINDMIFDPNDENKLIVAGRNQILSVDMQSGNREILATFADESFVIFEIMYDPNTEGFLVSNFDGLFSVDLTEQSLMPISTLITHPDLPLFGGGVDGFVSPEQNAVFLSGTRNPEEALVKVDLLTGNRAIFSNDSVPNNTNATQRGYSDILLSEAGSYIYLIANFSDTRGTVFPEIQAVDIENGNRVIVSKWQGPED